jgi:hypothetical protein
MSTWRFGGCCCDGKAGDELCDVRHSGVRAGDAGAHREPACVVSVGVCFIGTAALASGRAALSELRAASWPSGSFLPAVRARVDAAAAAAAAADVVVAANATGAAVIQGCSFERSVGKKSALVRVNAGGAREAYKSSARPTG